MKNRTSLLGIVTGLLLGLTCIAVSAYNTWTLLHLINHGIRVDAEVVSVKKGIKGGKTAQVQFTRNSGNPVRSNDMFQMILIRHKKGDEVAILYDPENTQSVVIDTGPWIWQQPVLLCLGGFFLIGLVFFLARMENREMKPLT